MQQMAALHHLKVSETQHAWRHTQQQHENLPAAPPRARAPRRTHLHVAMRHPFGFQATSFTSLSCPSSMATFSHTPPCMGVQHR